MQDYILYASQHYLLTYGNLQRQEEAWGKVVIQCPPPQPSDYGLCAKKSFIED